MSSPIIVDWVTTSTPGRLGATHAPGKVALAPHEPGYGRTETAADDLARLRDAYGVAVVVNLLESPEPALLKVPDLERDTEAAGLTLLRYPIRDGGAPEPRSFEFRVFLKQIHQQLVAGRTVVVHCRSGLGRTGLVIAAYLVEYEGLDPNAAIAAFRAARGGGLGDGAQLHYLWDRAWRAA